MKPIVIYHADCADGFGAAFAAWLKFGDDAEYLPMAYTDKEHSNWEAFFTATEPRDRTIYMFDFSLKTVEMMEALFDCAFHTTWRDHHKSAFEMFCGKSYKYSKGALLTYDSNVKCDVILDDNKSGALLAWEFFYPDKEVPMLIHHIDDRDRWVFAMEGSKELHAALMCNRPWTFAYWKALIDSEPKDANVRYLITRGDYILRAQSANIQQMLDNTRVCVIRADIGCNNTAGYVGLAVNASLHHSEIGHELANMSGTFGLIWYLTNENKVKCSLRSNGDYDVSAIAKAFGGGGHKNAAGFTTDIDTLMGWLA